MKNKSFIKAGVIGHPIAHSKSPLIHGHWIEKHGLEGSYEAIDLPCESFESGVKKLLDEGYAGFNITVPHKESAKSVCTELTDIAARVGAVNTIYKKGSDIVGTNTDVFGFIENINRAIRNFGFSCGLQYGPAVVLGAGGAARAIIAGLLDEKVPEIIIANRSPEKAEKLIEMDPDTIRRVEWDRRSDIIPEANFLVNTTSLGMQGQPALEVDLSRARENLLVSDIVYAPLMTDLLTQARQHDLRIVTGIGMPLHQARPAFEKWFGVMPDVDHELEEKVLSA